MTAPNRSSQLDSIPRDARDDFAVPAIDARRKLWQANTRAPARHVFGAPVGADEARGKIENFVGYAQVPLGIAGPLSVDTESGPRQVYVPMATTEGALVASYSRGMRILASGGGARARVLREGLTQNPIFVYGDAARAEAARVLAEQSFDSWARLVATTTRHGRLSLVRAHTLGRRLVVSFVFVTGDAIGINMAANATELCCAEFAERTRPEARYLHGQDVEKRSNARALIEGRGRSVVADAVLPAAALGEITRATPDEVVRCWRTYCVGYSELGTHNWTIQAANGLAAVMLACGQDVAYLTECATGFLDFDLTPQGDLYASVFLPSLLVGTVGGGSGQGTAAECLDLLGCRGAGSAALFAEILAATILAGDLSLIAAFCRHEFVAAHERLGRNRPSYDASPPRDASTGRDASARRRPQAEPHPD